MWKYSLLICALLLGQLAVAQVKINVKVNSLTNVTLTRNDTVINTSPFTIKERKKAIIITLQIPAALEDKVRVKIKPEVNSNVDRKTIFPPKQNKQLSINDNGVLEMEDKTVGDLQLGETIRLEVLTGDEETPKITSWEIKTGLRKLDEQGNVRQEKLVSAMGIPYYDAFALENTKDKAIILGVLGYYAGQDLDGGDVEKVFKGNNFILDYWNRKSESLGFRQSNRPGNKIKALVSSAVSSVGSLDVTNIADGFAKFLVKRTKQELNMAFFTKFKEELSKPEYRDLQTVFPQTWRALQAIGDEVYNYQRYIQTLRESFEKDLANLLTNIPSVIDNHPEFFKTQPELEAILRTAFYIAGSLQSKQHPGKIIANYPENYLTEVNPNYKAGIQTLKLLSNSLRYYDSSEVNADPTRYWVTEREIGRMFRNRNVSMIYLGLLEAEAQKSKITFAGTNQSVFLAAIIDDAFGSINTDLPLYESYLKTFSSKIEIVEAKIGGLSGVKKDSLLLENYYSFFSSTLDLLKFATEAESLPHFKELLPNADLKARTAPYFETAQTTADIAIDVNRRNYGSALTNAYALYNLIFTEDREQKVEALQGPLATAKTQHSAELTRYDELTASIKKEKNDVKREALIKEQNEVNKKLKPLRDIQRDSITLQEADDLLSLFYKYGTFMSTIVQAESSDEVEAAIEAFALPPGSSRIKRESSFNVSINAYTGLYGGWERIRGFDEGFEFNSFGVAAPIGVAISKGHSKFFWLGKGRHTSYSIFISLFDLGTIAAYRFAADSDADTLAQQVPTIEFKDIFSPGFFFSVGIPKTPLSVNLGAQLGPNLRKIEDDQGNLVNKYKEATYVRLSFSVLVDIPIVNLYTRTPVKDRRKR